MKKKVRFSRSWLALPYALFLAVFVVVPLFFIVYYAFRDDVTGELTFRNFKAFFTSPVNLKVAGRSLLISFLSTAVCLLIAYPVAYIIARCKLKNKSALLLLFIVPMWVNFVLRINALKELLDWMGLINKSTGWDIFNTVLGMVYDFLPFMILPIYSVIVKLDYSLLEAARDLGANNVTVFRKVILPLSLPGVLSGITMVFVPSVSTFAISRMLGGGTELLLGDLIERQFLGGAYNPQLGAAISLVMMIIVVICMLVMNRFGEGEEQAVML